MIGIYPGDELAFLFAKTLVQAAVLATRGWLACNLTASATRRFAIAFASLLTIFLLPVVNGGANALGLRIAELSFAPSLSADAALAQNANPIHVAWEILFAIWIAGMLLLLARFSLGIVHVWRLRKSARLIDWSRYPAARQVVEQRLSARRLPAIATSNLATGPQVVGVWSPLVLLPESLLSDLSEEELALVLIHECAHVVLSHPVAGFFQRLVLALFWPNPALYGVSRQMHNASEEICDNYAIAGGSRTEFARTLLALSQHPANAPALGLFGRTQRLEERIASLLSPQRRIETNMKTRDLAAALVLSLTLSALMASTSLAQTTTEKAKKERTAQVKKADKKPADAKTAKDGSVRVRLEKTNGPDGWKIVVEPPVATVTKTATGWTVSIPNPKANGKTLTVRVPAPNEGTIKRNTVVAPRVTAVQSRGVRAVQGNPLSTSVRAEQVRAVASRQPGVTTVRAARDPLAKVSVPAQVTVADPISRVPMPTRVTVADPISKGSVATQVTVAEPISRVSRPTQVTVSGGTPARAPSQTSTAVVQPEERRILSGRPVLGTTTVSRAGRELVVAPIQGTVVTRANANLTVAAPRQSVAIASRPEFRRTVRLSGLATTRNVSVTRVIKPSENSPKAKPKEKRSDDKID